LQLAQAFFDTWQHPFGICERFQAEVLVPPSEMHTTILGRGLSPRPTVTPTLRSTPRKIFLYDHGKRTHLLLVCRPRDWPIPQAHLPVIVFEALRHTQGLRTAACANEELPLARIGYKPTLVLA
jgi:hypothetical protein